MYILSSWFYWIIQKRPSGINLIIACFVDCESNTTKCTVVLPEAVLAAEPGSTAAMDDQPSVGVSKKLMHRIISGDYARPGEFPFQARLNSDPNALGVMCGGALIHPRWVLTAGHCFIGVKRIFVRLGVTDVWAKERWQFGEWADRLVPHPEYNPNKGSPNIRAHDIALIRLRRPAPIGQRIRPIPLPTPAEAAQRAGLYGAVTGWGRVSDGESFDPRLKVAYFTSMDPSICRRAFPKESTNAQLCVPGFGRGGTGIPCMGDSGGPFVSGGKVHGVVSYGPPQCSSGLPSVFTHVGSYLPWIYSHINEQQPVG